MKAKRLWLSSVVVIIAATLLALHFTGNAQIAVFPDVEAEGALVVSVDEAEVELRALGLDIIDLSLDFPPDFGHDQILVTVTNILAEDAVVLGEGIGSIQRDGTCLSFTVSAVPDCLCSITIDVPPKDNPDDFRFIVMGDSQGITEGLEEIIGDANSLRPLFVAHCGDLVPSGTEEQYETFIETMDGLDVPFFTVLGNHDIKNNGEETYTSSLAPPYYSFTYGDFRFIFLDSSELGIDEEQYSWLEGELQGDEREFVFLHVPPFDPVTGEKHSFSSPEDANRFMQLMSDGGVEAVFCGHIHVFNETVIDGVTYVITGGAGAPLYAPEDEGGFHHYVVVHVSESGCEIEVVPIEVQPSPLQLVVKGKTGGILTLGLDDLANMDTVEGDGKFQNFYGNWKQQGVYQGVLISDLVALVGGMGEGDELVIVGMDGYQERYSYSNVYPDGGWYEREGDMVLAYSFDGELVPGWGGGYRVAFLPLDGGYSNDDCAATSAEGQGWNLYESAGARWVRNVVLIEVVSH